MQAGRIMMLHKAIHIITKTLYFKNRLLSVSFLETAIQTIYELTDTNVSKATTSRTIGWLNPDNETLSCTNPIRIYSGSRAM